MLPGRELVRLAWAKAVIAVVGSASSSPLSSMWSLASASATPSSMMWGRCGLSQAVAAPSPIGWPSTGRPRATSASASPSSSSGSLARLLTVSPSSSLISRTPWVLRPIGADVGDAGADDHAAGGGEHDLVVVGHLGDGDDRPVAVAGLDVDQALAAAVLRAVLGQQRSACRNPWRRRSGGWPGRRRRWPRPCRRPRRPRPGRSP